MISAIRSVLHNSKIPVPEAPKNLEIVMEIDMQENTQSLHEYSDSEYTSDDIIINDLELLWVKLVNISKFLNQ